jgi:glycine betaine/proline transport system substrate-binding protein
MNTHLNTRLLILLLTLFMLLPGCGSDDASPTASPLAPTVDNPTPSPTNQKVVTIARADWDTGWFQAEIFRLLLEQLGYATTEPQVMANDAFYRAAARGDVDMWANGWFPLHNAFITEEQIRWNVEPIGSQVRGGALQGYLVDKRTANALDITSLDDFTRPDVVNAFDNDGDGKADLIGCNEGWGCEPVAEHHLDAYSLRSTVTHVQGEYNDLMDNTIEQYENGESIFFYTWTPNWTLGKLTPGRDVVWIEVPFSSLPDDQADQVDLTVVEGVAGCVNDPCNLGFPPNDIRAVASRAFLRDNPTAKRLLELVEIPLVDISVQNARMFEGEKSAEDIRSHAEEWIADNQETVNQWLAEATASEQAPPPNASLLQQVKNRGSLRCGVNSQLPGFSSQNAEGTYSGFNADFCRVIAAAVFTDANRVQFVPLTVQERFAAVSDREIDVLFHNTPWIATYDVGMDSPNSGIRLAFGPTIFHSGQGFMAHMGSGIGSVAGLQGRNICVQADTTDEQVLGDHLQILDIQFTKVPISNSNELYTAYENGACEAVSASVPTLISHRTRMQDPNAHVILGERISREPLSPAVREGDSQWLDVVTWSLYATIYAEELGVSQSNVEQLINTNDPEISYFLGKRGNIGKKLGLENTFVLNIIQQVGNYEDIYRRNLGESTPFNLDRGPNKVWSKREGNEGGVLSSPPFR